MVLKAFCSITSAFTILIQTRCETGEIKFTELLFQNRQYKTLWKTIQYPGYMKNITDIAGLDIPINHFYYSSPAPFKWRCIICIPQK